MLDENMILPCDVALPPGTIISKGCKLSTLLSAINRRTEWCDSEKFDNKNTIFSDEVTELIVTEGCYVDETTLDTVYPNCVLDYGRAEDCGHAKLIKSKEGCPHWKSSL